MKLPVYIPRSAPPAAWQPLGDRLLVRRVSPKAAALLNNSQESLVVPVRSSVAPVYEDCEWGVVVTRGAGRKLESVPGDLVLFKDWTSHQALNMGEYAIIEEADVRLRRKS